MLIDKIVGFVIITSLVVLQYVQSVTVNEYLGKWYFVAVVQMDPNQPYVRPNIDIQCEWYNLTIHEKKRIEGAHTFVINGYLLRTRENITVSNSGLSIIKPDGARLYTVESFDNFTDLIFNNMADGTDITLISRYTNASLGAINRFKQLAEDSDLYVQFFNNSLCSDYY